MCRNIKTLFNFEPPATDEEVRVASMQFVRKLSGLSKPSRANQLAFDTAADSVSQAACELLATLITEAKPRDRSGQVTSAGSEAVRFDGSEPVVPGQPGGAGDEERARVRRCV